MRNCIVSDTLEVTFRFKPATDVTTSAFSAISRSLAVHLFLVLGLISVGGLLSRIVGDLMRDIFLSLGTGRDGATEPSATGLFTEAKTSVHSSERGGSLKQLKQHT